MTPPPPPLGRPFRGTQELTFKSTKAQNAFYPLKAGINLKAVFPPLKMGLMQIFRLCFKQCQHPMLKIPINVLCCLVNFWIIFGFMWEEVVLKDNALGWGSTLSWCSKTNCPPYIPASNLLKCHSNWGAPPP